MTAKEIREFVKNSKQPEWFKTIEVKLTYPIIPFVENNLKGIHSIYRYYKNQVEAWENYESIPSQFDAFKVHYTQSLQKLEQFIRNSNDKDENSLISHWQQVVSFLTRNNNNRFPANHPDTLFLINLYTQSKNVFDGAFNYYHNNFTSRSKEGFQGLMLAYEFKQDGRSKISKNIDLRKKSLDRYRSEFKKKISSSEHALAEHLNQCDEHLKRFSEDINKFQLEKEKTFEDWFDPTKKEFEKFDKESKSKTQQLEKSYGELLKLKKPAEYWKQRAIKLNKDGWFATKSMITLIGIACIAIYILLVITPDGMIASFKTNTTAAIKWSILYVMFISFLAYGIRVTQRVAFSSFHLARDAEEREQLTYLYLSLIAESEISENDRTLVMQSLFSRADSGLLKEDSSPTMPNDIISKLINKA